MIAPARQAAYDAICRIEIKLAHSDDVLSSDMISRLETRDRNLVTEIVYGTLRWRAWLDYVLGAAISRPWGSVDVKSRLLLRLSLYQMAHMDRMPDHAVIHDAVELAKANLRPGAAGFVNGVLRALSRGRRWKAADFHCDCPLWIRVSLPQWLWERWEPRFGRDRACEYALSLNRPPRAAFRSYGRQPAFFAPACSDVLDKNEKCGSFNFPASELVPGAYLVNEATPAPYPGEARFQDEASQLIPHLLGPIEGRLIWDACAAPGGKSAILRERCGPAGWVISSDLDPKRARQMRQALLNCPGSRSDVLVIDARSSLPFRKLFYAVLLDVPCSGLGTLRRNPELKWRCRPERLSELSRRQEQLLESAAGAVQRGGLLLYSTCSTEPEENEFVVKGFLHSHSGFRLLKPAFPNGIGAWLDGEGMFRSFPSARLWDGFFAAVMVRAS